jgi:hypothetical protein
MPKLSKLERDTEDLIKEIAKDLPKVEIPEGDETSKKKIGNCENKVDKFIDLYQLEIQRICPGGNLNTR